MTSIDIFLKVIHTDRYRLLYYIKECMCYPDYNFENFFDVYDYILDYHKKLNLYIIVLKYLVIKFFQSMKKKNRRFNIMIMKKF